MVLSVWLSEFLVKTMDKGLPSGHFSRPAWLSVKTVLVTNWSASLIPVLFSSLEKKGNVKWPGDVSLVESQGVNACPALLGAGGSWHRPVSHSAGWGGNTTQTDVFQLLGDCTEMLAFLWNGGKSFGLINS